MHRLLLASGVALGLVVTGCASGSDIDSSAAPVSAPTTSVFATSENVAVAVQWGEARAKYDVNSVLALMAETAQVSMLSVAASVDELPNEMAWQEAYGFEFTFDRCSEATGLSDATSTTVYCYLPFEHPIAEINDRGPSSYVYKLVLRDGEVTSARLDDTGHHHDSVWVPLVEWLEKNRAITVDAATDSWDPTVWETYVAEFVTAHRDQ